MKNEEKGENKKKKTREMTEECPQRSKTRSLGSGFTKVPFPP